jgi:hypothetical protein
MHDIDVCPANIAVAPGALYVGCRGTLTRYDASGWQKRGHIDAEIMSLALAEGGGLHIGTDGGLMLYDGEKIVPTELSSPVIPSGPLLGEATGPMFALNYDGGPDAPGIYHLGEEGIFQLLPGTDSKPSKVIWDGKHLYIATEKDAVATIWRYDLEAKAPVESLTVPGSDVRLYAARHGQAVVTVYRDQGELPGTDVYRNGESGWTKLPQAPCTGQMLFAGETYALTNCVRRPPSAPIEDLYELSDGAWTLREAKHTGTLLQLGPLTAPQIVDEASFRSSPMLFHLHDGAQWTKTALPRFFPDTGSRYDLLGFSHGDSGRYLAISGGGFRPNAPNDVHEPLFAFSDGAEWRHVYEGWFKSPFKLSDGKWRAYSHWGSWQNSALLRSTLFSKRKIVSLTPGAGRSAQLLSCTLPE